MRRLFPALRIGLLLFFLGLFCLSAWKLWHIYQMYQTGQTLYDEIAAQVVQTVPPEESSTGKTGIRTAGESAPAPEESAGQAGAETDSAGITVDFDTLLACSGDVAGWLYCPDTPINYPVVQGTDNDYYLHHLLDGTRNDNGTLFIDAANAAGWQDQNTVIYGHHMKNGAMFASLEHYDAQTYYDAHPVIYLLTPDGNYSLELFAGMTVAADDEVYTHTFSDPDEYLQWLARQQERSDFSSAAAVGEGDRIVTLSTCAYDFQNARYVVLGKLVSLPAG